ncbi:helix-turn-helix transcriptional regulator [Virgisporangium aurantiacum]|uniref:helix-turn-helix transcriptional regulator n=1 Tax=Virgisporangium aurantiacum TaxID=175570 RepID=UPI00194E032D|nr:helix-turn-helix transcriptional regulator [Virgisporangium aurantiacum]
MPDRSLSVTGVAVPLLTAWGGSPDADLVFRFLVAHGPHDAEALRRELSMSRHRIAVALEELADSNAVRAASRPGRRGIDATIWHPRPPALVVAALRQRQLRAAQASLKVHRRLATLTELDPDLRVDMNAGMTGRPLHGLSRVRSRLGDLVDATRHEHLSMHPEPAFDRATVQASASLDHDLLARNVTVLSLGVPPSVEDITAAHTLELTHLGMQYRELPTLPAKMFLFDRRTVIVPMDPHDIAKGALEVAAPSMAERLAAWFMSRWSDARPPKSTTAAAVQLTPRERRVVALLAAGHTDTSAAARLGLSERTVAYAIRGVMERYGVQNRFQLGLVLGASMSTPDLAEDTKEKQ